ncbi:MAG TPA: hypothetical protein VEO00_06120 [Actinomycetota bacterium]|nr:hypothetical protein [Actinomycetota bacterium]
MATREELEALSSEELYERAAARAKHHLDVGFFWNLLRQIPAAEAVVGDLDEAQEDTISLWRRLGDYLEADEGELADALRPYYVEYLLEHGR